MKTPKEVDSIRLTGCIWQSSCRTGEKCIISSRCKNRIDEDGCFKPAIRLEYNGSKVFEPVTFFTIFCDDYQPRLD